MELLISPSPIACPHRRTCEVTTKEPNLMTSFVSGGMAGPARSVVVCSEFCSTRSIAKCDNHDLFRWVVA
jgi:hypothetical protein